MLQLGAGPSGQILTEVFPTAKLLGMEHDAVAYAEWEWRSRESAQVEWLHAVLDPALTLV